MASSKEWNSDLDVKGKIKVTDMPNQTGKPVVWNPATDTLSVREPSEMINDYNLVTTSRTITAGTGLTGGGNLSSNRTLNVDFGTGSNQVARGNHEHSWGDINNKPTIPTNNNQLDNGRGYISRTNADDRYLYITRYSSSSTVGFYVQTDIPEDTNSMFQVHFIGNGYSGDDIINITLQGYQYLNSDAFLQVKATALGAAPEIRIFNHEGFICFWFEPTARSQTYSVFVTSEMGARRGPNRAISILDQDFPEEGVTREVSIIPKKVWHEENFDPSSKADLDHTHTWNQIQEKPNDLAYKDDIPTSNSELVNDAGYLTANRLGVATIPPNTTGWFKLATLYRGTEQIALSFTGGSLTPHTYIVTYYKDWQNLQGRGNIIVEKHGNAGNYIPRFRLAESSDGETYLYGECVSRGSGLLIEVFQYSIKGYTSQSEVFIGELEQEDEVETIIYETDTVREGLNIKRVSSNSFVLNNSSNNEILLGGGSTQPLDELVTTNTNQTITGSKVFEGRIEVPNPTSSTHAVRKSYVDTGFFNKSGDTITNTEGGSITDMIKLYNRSIVDGTGAGIYAALSTNEEYYHGGLEVERTNTGGTHSTSTHLVARKTGSGTGKAFMERVLTVGYSGSTPFAATIAPFEADGIIKTGSSNNYLLLGGGGHTLLSTLMPSDASFNLKTNSLQRTTIGNGSDLDLIAGNNVSLSYGAGGKVTINSVDTNTNTTYTAGTGLSLSGTTFSLSGDSFDAGGNYATLRARGTTKADVGLGSVPNIDFRDFGLGNIPARRIDELGGENNDWFTIPHVTNAFVYGSNDSLNYPGLGNEYPIGIKIGFNENIGATIVVGRGNIPELRFRPDNSGNSYPWARVWHDVNLSPVTLDTNQTITGNKNFSGNLQKDGNDVWHTGNFNPSDIDVSDKVSKSGDTMTGKLVISSNTYQDHLELVRGSIRFGIMPSTGSSGELRFLATNATQYVFDKTVRVAGLISETDVEIDQTSDVRYKDNLSPIKNALELVGSLNGYTFNWNKKQETHTGADVGLSAQEVEKVLPEASKVRENGDKTVYYHKIVPVLIEANKELHAKVKDQDQKIASLEERLSKLEKLLL